MHYTNACSATLNQTRQ